MSSLSPPLLCQPPRPEEKQQQHQFPQPTYPANLYRPLWHSLRRREGTDKSHLPTLSNHDGFCDWSDIYNGVDKLIDALKGQTSLDGNGATVSSYRPPLSPELRAKLEATLATLETEAVQLGQDIELNQFRVKRGDPRGREERILGEMREQSGKVWLATIEECLRDVELEQARMERTAQRT